MVYINAINPTKFTRGSGRREREKRKGGRKGGREGGRSKRKRRKRKGEEKEKGPKTKRLILR